MRKVLLVIAVLFLSGCASLPFSGDGNYEKGVKEGKREMQATIDSAKRQIAPYAEPYKYVWDKGVTQKIIVPGAIRGGIFYPAHEETIIIVPPHSRLAPDDSGQEMR